MIEILAIIDAQVDFINGALGTEEAQRKLSNLVNRIDDFDGDLIIITQDTHDENYLNTFEGQSLPVEHCIEGTPGYAIHDDVTMALKRASAKGINLMWCNKPTFGAIDLVRTLDLHTFEEEFSIEFIGFCTDICVVSNALLVKTFFYNRAHLSVNAACCAGTTVENHEAALAVMRSCQIDVIDE